MGEHYLKYCMKREKYMYVLYVCKYIYVYIFYVCFGIQKKILSTSHE